MATIVLAAIAAVSLIGWVKRWMISELLIMLFEERGYPKPTEQEIERCSDRLTREILRKP